MPGKGPILIGGITQIGNEEQREGMVKADIVRSMEIQLGISHEEANAQVEQILAILKDQVADGEPVVISGFGKWEVRSKPARIGRNPKTLQEHEVSARRVVTFYPSNVWRDEISNNSKRE